MIASIFNSNDIFDIFDFSDISLAGEGFARNISDDKKESQSIQHTQERIPFDSLEMILLADDISSGSLDGVTAGLIVERDYGFIAPSMTTAYVPVFALVSSQSVVQSSLLKSMKPIHQMMFAMDGYAVQISEEQSASLDSSRENSVQREESLYSQLQYAVPSGEMPYAPSGFSGREIFYAAPQKTFRIYLPMPDSFRAYSADDNVSNVVPAIAVQSAPTTTQPVMDRFDLNIVMRSYALQNQGVQQNSPRDIPVQLPNFFYAAKAERSSLDVRHMVFMADGYKQFFREGKENRYLHQKAETDSRIYQAISEQNPAINPVPYMNPSPANYMITGSERLFVALDFGENNLRAVVSWYDIKDIVLRAMNLSSTNSVMQIKEADYLPRVFRPNHYEQRENREPNYQRENNLGERTETKSRIVIPGLMPLVYSDGWDSQAQTPMPNTDVVERSSGISAVNENYEMQSMGINAGISLIDATMVSAIVESGRAYFDDSQTRETFIKNYAQDLRTTEMPYAVRDVRNFAERVSNPYMRESVVSTERPIVTLERIAQRADVDSGITSRNYAETTIIGKIAVNVIVPAEILVKSPEILAALVSEGRNLDAMNIRVSTVEIDSPNIVVPENFSVPAMNIEERISQAKYNPNVQVGQSVYETPIQDRNPEIKPFDPTYLRNLDGVLTGINVKHGTNLRLDGLFDGVNSKPRELYKRGVRDSSFCAAMENVEAKSDGRLYNVLTNIAIDGIRVLYDGRVANAASGKETISMQIYQTLNSILANEQSVNVYGYMNIGSESRGIEKGSILYNVIESSNGTIVPVLMKYRDTVAEKDNTAVLLVAVNDANYLGKLKELANEQGYSQAQIDQINIDTVENSLMWTQKLGAGVVVQVREKGRNDFHEIEWDSSGSNPLERIAQEGLEYRVTFVGKNFYVPQKDSAESRKITNIEDKLKQGDEVYRPTKKDRGNCYTLDGLEMRLDGRLYDSSGKAMDGFQSLYQVDVNASEAAKSSERKITVDGYRTVNSTTNGKESVNRFGYERTGRREIAIVEGTPLHEILRNSDGKIAAVEVEYKDTVHQDTNGNAIYNKTLMLVAVNDANYLMALREEAKRHGRNADYVRNIRIDTVENSMKYSAELGVGLAVYLRKEGEKSYAEPNFIPNAQTPLLEKIGSGYEMITAIIRSQFYYDKSEMKKAA